MIRPDPADPWFFALVTVEIAGGAEVWIVVFA
jgi:hypothetical protein